MIKMVSFYMPAGPYDSEYTEELVKLSIDMLNKEEVKKINLVAGEIKENAFKNQLPSSMR